MDSHGTIVAAKSHSGMILGWDVNDLIGQEVSQTLVPERLRSAHLSGMAAVAAGRESKLANKRVPLDALHRDGHLVPIDLIVVVGQSTDPPVFTGMILSRQAGVQGRTKATPDEVDRDQVTIAVKGIQRHAFVGEFGFSSGSHCCHS